MNVPTAFYKTTMRIFLVFLFMLLVACASREQGSEQPVANKTQKERKEPVQPLPFPRYLLPEGFQMGSYNPIIGTPAVSVEITGSLQLDEVVRIYKGILLANYWVIDETKTNDLSFLMKATKEKNGKLELRGIQGTGITSLFLIYEGDEGDFRFKR